MSLNEAKYFSSGTLQNCLIYFSYKNISDFSLTQLTFYHENLWDFQMKVLKIYLHQTPTLLKVSLIIIHYQM